mgnify:CR=1 FL=1
MRGGRAPLTGTTMDLDRHDFQLDQLMERIQANDNRLIALQIPEGLKMQALEMMDTIETETSAKVVLAADPCYCLLYTSPSPRDRG